MDKVDRKIGFIGLGYAGFPTACLFSGKFKVVGFDLSKRRVAELQSCVDHCGDVPSRDIRKMFENGAVISSDINDLKDCNVFIITVPTPVDKRFKPDMSYISNASREVGSILKKGDIVIYESTVYPGATEEICVPILEEASGLKFNEDFFVGYSPERINPGDKHHTPLNVVKVTSGSTPESARIINDIYSSVLGRDMTYSVSSIKVAEACKVVENAQRDVNIAFINEVAKVLNAFDIDTNEVVDAMNTKWNALDFRPGLVGGHCIAVDPYYLVDKAKSVGIDTRLINTARKINNTMAEYVVSKVEESLRKRMGGDISKAKVLLLGFTFKENCPDIRNTKVYDVYRGLKRIIPDITIYDPHVDNELARGLYGIKVSTNLRQISHSKYDAVVLCVAHNEFKNIDLKSMLTDHGFVYDIKGLYPVNEKKEIAIERI